MPLVQLLLVAVVLAIDAFAVSVAAGLHLRRATLRQSFRLSFHFGLFQALMPILGWLAGGPIRTVVEAWDHWVAFSLLALVGGKMIKDVLWPPDDDHERVDPTRGTSLVVLSVATSIDALAVGLSLAMVEISVWVPALVIGLVAGAGTMLGLHLGRFVGGLDRLARWASLAGGLVLLAIGARILWEHGAFG
jgi:putative Mn2+ efflux pump MntP